MKKQILTLSMCLALSATAALASGTATVAKKVPAAPQKVVKTVPVATVTQTAPALTPEQEARKRFEAKMIKERELLFNALNITPEQKAKIDALDKKNMEEAKPLFDKMRAEKAKLYELKSKSVCQADILAQKQELKKARKAIKAHFKASRKAFEALLTKDQLAKFKILKEEKRAEMKKLRCKDGHKRHHRPGFDGPKGPCGPGFGPGPEGPPPQCPPPCDAPKCPCAIK